MTSGNRNIGYFAAALQGRRDITDSYEVLGDIPELVGISSQNEDAIVDIIRNMINGQTDGIASISETVAQGVEDARDLYHDNLIAAVDGTDAVSALRFVSDTIYAVGVVLVTPRTQYQPRAHVTRTRASHIAPSQNLTNTWEKALQEWAEYLRGAREQEQSWINTFREYEEREMALDWLRESESHIVLLDGPILTQNMLTQDRAHDLLEQLVDEQRAIGFIKDLSANPLLSAIGYALRPGETFVMREWSNVLYDRFRHGQQNISDWIEKNAEEVIRAIYKVNRKAFAIECLAEYLPLAFGILKHDNTGSLDHDIPMLLQIADHHVRSKFNGTRARDEVVARFSASDPARFLPLVSERSLR